MAKAYTDGANRKTVSACSYVVYNDDGSVFFSYANTIGKRTNNEAEYLGLIALLSWANAFTTTRLTIYSDSMLVVEQVNGRWRINNENLLKLRTQAWGLLVRGGHTLEHVKGHSGNVGNEEADRLCNEVMDRYENTLNGQVMDHA